MNLTPYRSIFATGLLAVAFASAPGPAAAQVGNPSGGPGTHVLIGVMGGRFDLRDADRLDVLGGRAGLGLGDRIELNGFYWQSIDTDERDFLRDRAWGGELQANLTTRFAVVPFVTGGVARLRLEDAEYRTAGTVGAGLSIPFGPVQLRAAATDFVLGMSMFEDDAEETTHNWLFTAGLTVALGRDRPRPPVVVAQPPRRTEPVVVAQPPRRTEPVAVVGPRTDTVFVGALQDYQSDRQIQLPIPLEGSITIRYGPDAGVSVAAAPADRPLAQPDPRLLERMPPDAAAVIQDPAVQAWLRSIVSAQVAEQLARQPAAQLPGEPSERLVERVLDATMARLLPQLEAAEVRRTNLLREDLRQAVAAQREVVRDEVARLEARMRGEPVPPARDPAELMPRLRDPVEPPVAAVPPEPAPRPQLDPAPAARPAAPVPGDAGLRMTIAELAARHAGVMRVSETERGPAIVIGDAAFPTGSALVQDRARAAVLAVAAAIARDFPNRFVFVQGHTDSVGPEVSNQRLSELRAETVRSLLVQGGIDPGRVHAIGFGEARPVASNDTAAGRAANRRVEIVIGPPVVPNLAQGGVR